MNLRFLHCLNLIAEKSYIKNIIELFNQKVTYMHTT